MASHNVSRTIKMYSTVEINYDSASKLEEIKASLPGIGESINKELDKSLFIETSVNIELRESDETSDIAEIDIEIHATQNAVYHEARMSTDWYMPDDGEFLEGSDDEETISEVVSIIVYAFDEAGFDIDSEYVDIEDDSRSWDNIIEVYNEDRM